MSAARRREPRRFRDRGEGADARAALLAEAAREAQPLDAAAFARIRANIEGQVAPPGWVAFRSPAFRRTFTLAVFAVVGLTAAGGARALWMRYVRSPLPVTTVALPPAPRRLSRTAPRTAATPMPSAGADEQAPPETSAPPPPPPPHREPARVRPSTPEQPSEAETVARALSELRQHKDPHAALALLDRHDRQFPRGVLQAEALRARVEALVASGDLDAALALLDARGAAAADLGADLLLARAELRAAKGRYRDALEDFDALLDGQHRPSRLGEESALYGRAISLGHLGQDAQARADLGEYQRRFPSGRFAAEVARLLAGPTTPAAHP